MLKVWNFKFEIWLHRQSDENYIPLGSIYQKYAAYCLSLIRLKQQFVLKWFLFYVYNIYYNFTVGICKIFINTDLWMKIK